MILLDLYCCQGGASRGYADAGFKVVGVDIEPQPRYPHTFIQGDAVAYAKQHGAFYDAVHASPPCQGYSDAAMLRGNDHPLLIAETRAALEALGLPYVIENVGGARPELRDPVLLCGEMFGIRTYRHRLFETNWPLPQPYHPSHVARQAKMGRPPKGGEYIQCVGNFSGVQQGREAMGMPWASRDGLREAIPPAYTRYVGEQLRAVLT